MGLCFRKIRKFRVHKDGVVCFVLLTAVSVLFSKISVFFGGFFAFVAGWCLYFFRVPNRVIPQKEGSIVSPADGRVVAVQRVAPPQEFGLGTEERTRVSIFLSIFDVHINYIPMLGKIRSIYYQEGHFFHAGKDKASEHNEKNTLVIDIPWGEGNDIGVVQIAGLIARRIRCDVKNGEDVATGQYYGLIRFGSRLEVYLPRGVLSSVQVGDRVLAAATVLAEIPVDLLSIECGVLF
ncbi:MAG: phosphatidylserine decarboxylase family protein [Holosporales bacterium]|jgi:phosphatidylserine decarboxylase|nr:phosphatidylserine decarboxylase family protein [Holosporales bacterium]